METALDTLPHSVWMRDASGDLVWVNKAYAALMGTVQDDACAGQMEITVSAKGRAPRDMAREALSSGQPQSNRCHIIAQGKRRWMEITETPLAGTTRTLGFASDLTGEDEARSSLDRNVTANKALLEQMRTAVAIFGADQAIEFFNSAFTAQWGLEEQWLNNRPKLGDILEKLRDMRRLPEQADFRKYKQGWLDMFTRLIDPHEDMLYLPDDTAVRMLAMPHPMGGLMMIFEDVTSRLQLESSYNTLMAVQRETLDNLAEGVVVYGGDGRLKLWNPSFATIWGLKAEDMANEPHINRIIDQKSSFFAPDDWSGIRSQLIEHGLERAVQEGRMTRTDGIHLRYATVPLPDGGVMVSYYDITDSVRVETALRDKNAALEAAEQLKTDFLANVSYQLRTPLNAIMGFSEILDLQYFGSLNERQKEYTAGIHESGQRLISLIDDILDLSTIEAGYLELSRTDVAVKPMLEGLYDLTMEWARKRKLSVKLTCPDNIGCVSADERRLKQAILNLIRNAINFTPENGKIEIKADKTGDSLNIEIIDTGVGISKEDMDRIFQPFERTTTSKGTNGHTGAGLGLTLVKNIIELHGGTIEISSVENLGTTVKAMLPI
ncbi:MAG: sensor histidine kinase [Micavibrio aeruginosavorus]|uniref:histidine kinase n=1 Tax=Micavibrio aeruginosavorus TaxID=349221 RepID=A0A2W5BZL5_9BACT|nr:MAG: sensor histidine kinase [Micavibrio aeruginosavorus]